MSLIETTFPATRRMPRFISRDLAILLLVALNEIMLGLETYLAHIISRTVRPNEWIPIILGPVLGIMMLAALLLYRRQRTVSAMIAFAAFLTSIVVGFLGTYFHLARAILPSAPTGQQISLARLVWSPPPIAPLVFVLIGVLGFVAYMFEKPPDSGWLQLSERFNLQLPLSKTRIYFLLTSLGILLAAVSGVMDHVHTDFANNWLWVPTAIGIFGTVVPLLLGLMDRPARPELIVYTLTMLLLIGVGPLGVFFHVKTDLNQQNVVVIEQFIRRAPVLAPLVFSNMGLLGLLVLLPPRSDVNLPK